MGSRSSLYDLWWNDTRKPNPSNRAPIIVIYYFATQLNPDPSSLSLSPSRHFSLHFSRHDLHRLDSECKFIWLFMYFVLPWSQPCLHSDPCTVYSVHHLRVEHKIDDYNSKLDIGRSLCVRFAFEADSSTSRTTYMCQSKNTHDRASYSTVPGKCMFTTTQRTLRPTHEEKNERRKWRKRMVWTTRKDFILDLITSENANLYKVTPCKRGTKQTEKKNKPIAIWFCIYLVPTNVSVCGHCLLLCKRHYTLKNPNDCRRPSARKLFTTHRAQLPKPIVVWSSDHFSCARFLPALIGGSQNEKETEQLSVWFRMESERWNVGFRREPSNDKKFEWILNEQNSRPIKNESTPSHSVVTH